MMTERQFLVHLEEINRQLDVFGHEYRVVVHMIVNAGLRLATVSESKPVL
jgi:hypothetical protein